MLGPTRLRRIALVINAAVLPVALALWLRSPDADAHYGIGRILVPIASGSLVLYYLRVWMLVRARGVNLCLHCGQSMDAVPGASVCPRCGRPHDAAESKRLLSQYTLWLRGGAGPSVGSTAPPHSFDTHSPVDAPSRVRPRRAKRSLVRRLWGIDDPRVTTRIQDECDLMQLSKADSRRSLRFRVAAALAFTFATTGVAAYVTERYLSLRLGWPARLGAVVVCCVISWVAVWYISRDALRHLPEVLHKAGRCPSCGYESLASAERCSECGHDLNPGRVRRGDSTKGTNTHTDESAS